VTILRVGEPAAGFGHHGLRRRPQRYPADELARSRAMSTIMSS
jgi:hypothetical protein